MFATYPIYLTLLAVLSSPAMAAPVDTLSSIHCHCLTFYTYSPPATCNLPHSQNLSWDAAQSFASANDLDITFASRTTVSRVLQVERPLPTSALMGLYGGLALGRARSEVGSRVVCGSWDEVSKKYVDKMREGERRKNRSRAKSEVKKNKCDGFVSEVVCGFVIYYVFYVIVDRIWTRFFPRQRQIQLTGDEKDILAFADESAPETAPELNEKRPSCEPTVHTTPS